MISPSTLLFVLLLMSALAYYLGLRRSVAVAGGPNKVQRLHSRPPYYGMLTALWCGLPALIVFSGWQILETDIITQTVIGALPAELKEAPADRINLIIGIGFFDIVED
jgi:phosphate transport system permease protein